MPAASSADIYDETLAVFDRSDDPFEPLTTPEVAEALDANRRTVYKRLSKLADSGALRTKQVGSRARVWWPAEVRSDDGVRSDDARRYARKGGGADLGRTSAALRESEERYRTLFASIDQGFCIVEVLFDDEGDPVDYRFLETNPAFEEQTGLASAVGRTMLKLEPNHERHWFETYGAVAKTGEPVRFEAKAEPLVDGWYSVYAFPYGGPDSRQVAILFGDVTERKDRERELERYENILQTVPDGVWALDADDRFEMVNDAYCELTGYDREALIGEHATLVTSESVNESAKAFGERMREGALANAALEVDLRRADGTTVPVESHFTQYEVADGTVARCGVVRDVSDRKENERALAASERRYRTLVDNFPNGAVALFDADLRHLTVGGTLFAGLDLTPGELEGQTLREALPASMVDRMEPHFRAVFDGEAREFEVSYDGSVRTFHAIPVRDDDGDVVAGLGMSQDVTERRERERQLESQRQRFATLNHLGTVIRDVTRAVVDRSTRAEIERTVCESLAASDAYEFAWIAEVDPSEGRIIPRAEAGVDGYLDDWIAHSTDPDHLWNEGPVGRVLRTGEPQVTHDVFEESDAEDWHEYAKKYGYRSVAAIPVSHENSLYGVLGLYASDPDAFAGPAMDIVGQLDDVVGHAIASAERKQALMGDDLVELQFQIPQFFDALGVGVSMRGRITFERTAPVDDGDVLAYGVATDDGIDALEAVVAGNPSWKSVSVIDRTPDSTRFVARVSEPPIVTLAVTNGGYLVEATVEDEDSYLTVHLPTNVDVRRFVGSIRESYPDLVMVARRQIQRTQSPRSRIQHILTGELTERQRVALEAAFNAGYFDRPRRSSGEEVARTLGVSTSTFHQHLRVAVRKLVDGMVSATGSGLSSPSSS